MSRYQEDLWDTLYEVRQAVGTGDWATFDTETTGLNGQIIAWAVCASDGSVMAHDYAKPTCQ